MKRPVVASQSKTADRDDRPLDPIEKAIVKALAAIIIREISEDLKREGKRAAD